MFATLQTLHGHWRWLIAAVALLAILKFLIGLISNAKVSPLDKTLASAFAGVMTVQLVLGGMVLVNFFLNGALVPRLHGEHLLTGLVAVGLSHAIPLRKEERPDRTRFGMATLFVVLSLVASLLNVILVRGSWTY
jgi:hypothetical protein